MRKNKTALARPNGVVPSQVSYRRENGNLDISAT
jgi:hypothetical protein